MSTQQPATILRLGPSDHGRLVSAEEFAEAEYVEPWTYERDRGRLDVMAPDGQAHSDCSEPWRDLLGAYKLAHPDRVAMVKSSAWVRNPDGIDRIADIAVYLQQERPTPQIPDRVPEIAFEIVSPGPENRRRDYVEKRRDYHALGIAEYVIIDRFEAKVTVFTHQPDGYAERVLTAADTYESPHLPGFAVPLAGMFAP